MYTAVPSPWSFDAVSRILCMVSRYFTTAYLKMCYRYNLILEYLAHPEILIYLGTNNVLNKATTMALWITVKWKNLCRFYVTRFACILLSTQCRVSVTINSLPVSRWASLVDDDHESEFWMWQTKPISRQMNSRLNTFSSNASNLKC